MGIGQQVVLAEKELMFYDKSLERKTGSLSPDDWLRIIDDATYYGMRHFSIIGKEPLLTPEKTIPILEHIEEINEADLIYELITNGTLVKKNIESLEALNFNFFSISFDGFMEDHDLIRGKGNYKRAREGLISAKEARIANRAIIFKINWRYC